MTNSELLERFRELEARLQKVNTELDGLRVAIKGRTFTEKKELEQLESDELIRVGDYVRYTYQGGEGVGMLIGTPDMGIIGDARVKTWSFDKVRAWGNIKKWQPKKGDLCIFWDRGYNGDATISIYLGTSGDDSFPYTSENDTYQNCIPFLSEQQYKRHIGYEE